MTRYDGMERLRETVSVRQLDDGDTVLYDPENDRAWVRSDLVVEVER